MRWLTPCVLLALALLSVPHAQALTLSDTEVQPRETPLSAVASTPVGDAALAPAAVPAKTSPAPLRAPQQHVLAPALALDAPYDIVKLHVNETDANASDAAKARPGAQLETREVNVWGKGLASDRVLDGLRLHVAGDGGALTPQDARELRKALLLYARGASPRGSFTHFSWSPAADPKVDPESAPQPGSYQASGSTPLATSPAQDASTHVAPPPPPTHPWIRAAVFAGGAALLVLAPWALYHRLRGKRTLEQDKRAALTALLHERPGLSPSELARGIGLDPSTVRYHLHRLVKEGLVIQEGPGSGRHARYFAPGTIAASERPAIAIANSQESTNVLDVVRQTPGLTMTEISTRMSLGRTTVSWHLRKLALARLVRLERHGRAVRVLPEATGTPMST